jgi:hypothetical protein
LKEESPVIFLTYVNVLKISGESVKIRESEEKNCGGHGTREKTKQTS